MLRNFCPFFQKLKNIPGARFLERLHFYMDSPSQVLHSNPTFEGVYLIFAWAKITLKKISTFQS